MKQLVKFTYVTGQDACRNIKKTVPVVRVLQGNLIQGLVEQMRCTLFFHHRRFLFPWTALSI
jgi:hypothetical protein